MLRFIVVLYMYVRCIKKTLFKIKIDLNNVIGKNTCDVNKATKITENMKLAASKALATLAKLEVPAHVKKAHNREDMSFGPNYIIPSPFDRRVLIHVASAVAKAAIEDGVARVKEFDIEQYKSKG